jgi:hypothetical protein
MTMLLVGNIYDNIIKRSLYIGYIILTLLYIVVNERASLVFFLVDKSFVPVFLASDHQKMFVDYQILNFSVRFCENRFSENRSELK